MGLGSPIDMFRIGSAARSWERFDVAPAAQYAKVAFEVERRVQNGLDPLAGEAELAALSAAQADAYPELPPKAEKAAVALGRLVEKKVIDPIFAEHMLDTGFSKASVMLGLDSQPINDDLLA
jgi:hypothetical protein